jgi:hypothetical protein
VARPDEFMPGAWEEISLILRLETTVTTLVSTRATSSAAVKRLQDHRFSTFPVMARNTRDGKAIRCFFQALSRRAPHAPRHHSVSTSLCGVCIPFRLSHGGADGRIALLTKGCIFLLQYNILDYGVWPEQCGRWAMSMDSSWRRSFTTHCLQKSGKVCRIMRIRPRHFETL